MHATKRAIGISGNIMNIMNSPTLHWYAMDFEKDNSIMHHWQDVINGSNNNVTGS